MNKKISSAKTTAKSWQTGRTVAKAGQPVVRAWQVKFRVFLWLVLAFIVGWLLYMAIVPGGKITYIYDFEKDSRFIGKLTPIDRVETSIGNSQKIIGNPVYFSLSTLRKFNQATLVLKYKNTGEFPLIEAGVLVDKIVWRYDLKPVENKIIDQVALVWDVIKDNGAILLQREKKYNSIDEFLNNMPDIDEVALYNYDLKKEYLLNNYIAGIDEQVIDFSLRGPYQFYTYIKDEDLDFNFTFLDINNNKDLDPIDLHLYYDNKLIDSRHMDDDGIAKDTGETKDERVINFKVANLPEGVYKIELRASDDIITKKITAKQSKLAFLNKIWFYKDNNTDIEIWTDSKELQAKTVNPTSLQIIKTGEKELEIKETYKQFRSVLDVATSTRIKLAKDGIILTGDGVFSFKKDSLINSNFKKVNQNLDINKENVNYVLAKYAAPKEEDGWKIAEIEFDLTKAYREDQKYGFLISIPGLTVDDDIDDYIEIGGIKIELKGKTLFEKIKEIINKK